MEIDAKKFFSLNSKQKKLVKYLNIFLLLVILPLSLFVYFTYAINRPAQNFKDINYNLKSGSSLENIASDLKQLEVINSESLFIFYVKIQRA